MSLSRRSFLASGSALALASLAGPVRATSPEVPFSHDTVVAMARDLSRHRYLARKPVPQDWLDLSYEQYKSIWFRHDRALWHQTDRPYEVDFFHPGLYFPRPVQIDTVENGTARMVPFDLGSFDRTDKVPQLSEPEDLGFSGFRLRTELDQPGIRNEFAVFQGASYFRAIGIGEIYGLSARGLALKTADPMGEEFPDFTRFWLETPEPGQRNIIVHALLDSPSVAGAYRFDITPGPSCVMDVEATLFPRTDLTHLGLGPLTSMFLFDSTNRTRFDDFRPAVHDSDGLMIVNGNGETLWRALANPKTLQISAFGDNNPRGFGLMQRARKLSDFADLEALYHRRPGLWVEPRGDWGKGAVTLVEIPADKEIYDNIVAYWRPQDPIPAGSRHDFAYRLTWGQQAPIPANQPRVLNTSSGARESGGRIVTVDFEDHPLFDDGPEALTPHISSPHAEVSTGVLQRNPETGGLRLAFSFDPGERALVELRAQLRKGAEMASEVWLYRWTA
ncbi:glucan biosynthesis protein G [Seohaeicola saemankumensis]|nr:glucan biosynthesis protein G [Seohaeicola saemankumensis]MCA0872457.1 glucan biosynthesis protein G [Seohaeicola saemankumensis]